jgi:hypothetical protein
MPIVLGGNKARFVRSKGDISASFQYIGDDDSPAMCLFPSVKKSGSGSYIITESVAHTYTDEFFLIYKSWVAAHLMGFDVPTPPHNIGSQFSYTPEEFLAMFIVPPLAYTREMVAKSLDMGKAKARAAIPKHPTITAVADAILLWMDDLMMMPPSPEDYGDKVIKKAIGEASITIDGVTRTHEVCY